MFGKQKSFLSGVFTMVFAFALMGAGCSGGGGKQTPGAPEVGPQTTTPPTTASGGPSCPSAGVRLINSQNQDVSLSQQKSLYYKYEAHISGYATTVASFEDNGKTFSARNLNGSTLKMFKDDVAAGQPVDAKSPVLSTKIARFEGDPNLSLIVGTLTDLQVFTIDAGTGALTGEPKKINSVGGVVSLDVSGKDIYAATVDGDVVKVGSDLVSSGGGCAGVSYQAKDDGGALNRKMKAFRVAAAEGQVHFLTSNYGNHLKNVQTMADFLVDIAAGHFPKWKTQLNLIRADGSVAELTTDLENQKTLAQDLVSDGKNVYFSFVSYPTREVDSLIQCYADLTACNGASATNLARRLLALLLNANFGIMAYHGDGAVGSFVLDPTFAMGEPISGLGCPVNTPGCLRIPNLLLGYRSTLAVTPDKKTLHMHAVMGDARLDGLDQVGTPGGVISLNLELQTSISNNALGLSIPFKSDGISKGMLTSGFLDFFGWGTAGSCTGGGCNSEKGTFSTSPMVGTTVFDDDIGKSIKDSILIEAGHGDAYVYAGRSFTRINVSNSSDITKFKVPLDSPVDLNFDNPRLAAIPWISEQTSGPDRIIAFFEDPDTQNVRFAEYISNQPDPVYKTPVGPPSPGIAPFVMRTAAYQQDAIFIGYNYIVGGVLYHGMLVLKANWGSLPQLAVGGNIVGLNGLALGYRMVENTGNHYIIYLPVFRLSPFQIGVDVVEVDYDPATGPNGTVTGHTHHFTQIQEMRGLTAGNGKYYVVKKNGDLTVHKLDGTVEKTLQNFFGIDQANQEVAFSLPTYNNGEIYASAIGSSSSTSTTPSVFVKLASAKVDDSSAVVYDLNPSFLIASTAGKKLFTSSILNSGGLEMFDLTKTTPPASNIVVGGGSGPSASSTPPPGDGSAGTPAPAGAAAPGPTVAKSGGGGGCALNQSASASVAPLLVLLFFAPIPILALRRRSR